MVSTQYKSVFDAIRANSKTFLFVDEDASWSEGGGVGVAFGEELRLIKTCGAFITMRGSPGPPRAARVSPRPAHLRLCRDIRTMDQTAFTVRRVLGKDRTASSRSSALNPVC